MQLMSFATQQGQLGSLPLPAELNTPNTLVMVFGPSDMLEVDRGLASLRAQLPQAHWLGASTGTAINNIALMDQGVSVAIAQFEHTALHSITLEVAQASESAQVGEQLAQQLMARAGLAAVLLLSDGLLVNGPMLVQGMNRKLPAAIPVAGGLAGDGEAFARTWTMSANGHPTRGAVTAIGLYGERVQMRRGCRGGSVGFGPKRIVTKSEGNVLQEIDGTPALQLYKNYLGEQAQGLPGAASHFPLTVFRNFEDREPIIRYVLGIDNDTDTITVAGDVPKGCYVQLSRAGRSELLTGAARATRDLCDELPDDRPVLNMVVSCIGRRLVLGEQCEEELEALLDLLPPRSVQAGFYSYGEISAVDERVCDMHNMTLTMASVWEV